jgi:ubiquinone biosynthesis protein UbiJ
VDGIPVSIRLGAIDPDGVAPILFGLVARGAERRATLVRAIDGEVELRLAEVPVPLRIAVAGGDILVEDGSTGAADVVIHGRLADLAQLMVSPAIGGVPLPTDPRGRAALGSLATQRVRIEGKRMLARKLLALLAA